MSHKTLGPLDFKKETHHFRKFLSIVLLLILIGGYSFLIIYNLYISFATSEIRVEPSEFEQEGGYSNETIAIGGEFLVDNDHWYSIDIRDFTIDYEVFTDDDVKIASKKTTQQIPKQEKTKIKIEIGLDKDDYTLDEFKDLAEALNQTKSLLWEIEVSFKYGLYEVIVNAELESDFEGIA